MYGVEGEEVSDLSSGELDALIAEKVMGLTPAEFVLAYSTDISAAMEVETQMAARGFSFSMKHYVATKDEGDDVVWAAAFYNKSDNFMEVADTKERAICFAAVAAVGEK